MRNKIQVIIVDHNNYIAFPGAKSDNFDVPVIITDSYKRIKSIFLRVLRKIHFSRKVNKILDLPFKHIWATDLGRYVVEADTEYYFIFSNATLFPLSPDKLNALKNKGNVHYIMLWGDPYDSIHSEKARYYYSRMKFDRILTINLTEAAERGFTYTYIPYDFKIEEKNPITKNDIYFVGGAKDRLDFLLKIYEKLTSEGVNANFRITGADTHEQRHKGQIVYNEPIPYQSVLEHVGESNCILEVLAYGQTGATLRYYEAVVNNKKLLTNNKNVINLPFYDSRFIHVFESIDDIDTQWIKKKEDIDYRYDGRFSLTRFIDRIINLESEKDE